MVYCDYVFGFGDGFFVNVWEVDVFVFDDCYGFFGCNICGVKDCIKFGGYFVID